MPTTINITAADSGGAIAGGMPFRVDLVTGQSRGGHHSGGEIAKPYKGNLSNAGTGSFPVIRNDEITPAGSKYKVTLGEGIWWIQVNGAGPYDLGAVAIQTDDIVPAVSQQGAPGGTGYVDDLAALPDPAAEADGVLMSALDVADGTLYVVNGGVLRQMAPSVAEANAGQYLGHAQPTSSISVGTVGTTLVRVTQMTTAAFEFPSSGIVRADVNDLLIQESGATAVLFACIGWTKNGGSTWQMAGRKFEDASLVSGVKTRNDSGFAAMQGFRAIIPGPSATGSRQIAGGDTVQVALFLVRSTGSASPIIYYADNDGSSLYPNLLVTVH